MSKNLPPQLSFPDIREGFRNAVRMRLRCGLAVTKIAHVPTRFVADLTFIQIAFVSTEPSHFRNAGEFFFCVSRLKRPCCMHLIAVLQMSPVHMLDLHQLLGLKIAVDER